LRFTVQTVTAFILYECAACGFVFAWPRPEPEYLSWFYSSAYFAKPQAQDIGYVDYRSLPELNAKTAWDEFKSLADVWNVPGHRILDVGCATGGFLSRAKQEGWDCIGVEISEDAARVARREYGLHVLTGDIDTPELAQNDVDVITMWHVLEHMLDPAAALIRARDLLRYDGLLFIELPNWNSFGRTVRGVHWSALTPPEHINFFTPRSLRYLVDQSGFRTVTAVSTYPSLQNEAHLDGPGKLSRQIRYAIARVACAVGRGGYVRLTARAR
jgi:SAM-dependent methyltransferase